MNTITARLSDADLSICDIERARHGAAVLRRLVDSVPNRPGTVTIAMGDVRVSLAADMVDSVVKALEAIVAAAPSVGSGEADAELSPQDAATLLNMSRPTVMRLMRNGRLGSRMVGSHHRLSRNEVIAFRDGHASIRRAALANLARLSDEYGL